MKRLTWIGVSFLSAFSASQALAVDRVTQPKQTYKNRLELPILMSSFIPNDNIDDPTPLTSRVFEGDARFFSTTPASSRTRERITAVPVNSISVAGFRDGSQERHVGESRQYDKASSLDPTKADALDPDGKLTEAAKADTNLDDDKLMLARGTASNETMQVFVDRTGERKIRATLKGAVSNPLVFAASLLGCSITWNYQVTVDGTDRAAPTFSFTGTGVRYPAYEAYIGSQVAHQFDPIETGTDATSLCLPTAQFSPKTGVPISE